MNRNEHGIVEGGYFWPCGCGQDHHVYAKEVAPSKAGIHYVGKHWRYTCFVDYLYRSQVAYELFVRLRDIWLKDTQPLSIRGDEHPSYRAIIEMGEMALPFIFFELRDYGGHWFAALYAIVGTDVAINAQTVPEAREEWIAWAKDHYYLP